MQSSALNSLLIQAVQDNETKKVEDYLSLGASPNQMIDSKTHLIEVALDKDWSILLTLISHSEKNKPNNAICHQLIAKAIATKKSRELEILLSFTQLTKKETLFYIFDIIKEGNLTCLQVFLAYHIDYLNMKQNNVTPLDYAYQLEQKTCVETIIKIALKGSYKMISSLSLNTLLIQAVKNNDRKKVEDYLSLGASSNQMIDSKTHLLEHVLEDKNDNLELLGSLTRNSKDKPTKEACHRLIMKVIDMQKSNTLYNLLSFFQLTNKEMLPYIFDVIKKGKPTCLKVFLDFRKDFLAMKKNNISPMDYATSLGRKACIQVLINAALEYQYDNEFKKIKKDALASFNVFLYWNGLSISVEKFEEEIKKFKKCNDIMAITKICQGLRIHSSDEFYSSDHDKIHKFIDAIKDKFSDLQKKITDLNTQKAQCPMTEEIQKDSKDHYTFYSISRIKSASQIESINDSSLGLETPRKR